jgi:hypothetical protein
MREIFQVLAVLCAALFSGAALYISAPSYGSIRSSAHDTPTCA